jgi:hypothetical protein
MNRIQKLLTVFSVFLAMLVSGCPEDGEVREEHNSTPPAVTRGEHGEEGRGEHDRDRGGEGEGEESGAEYALSDTYNEVRNGARLILAYDAQSKSFNGTVENTTNETLERVRVEVHLSNGKELGPTTPISLGPGEKRDVKLTVTSAEFAKWSAHAEVGNEEHGGSEGSGEHGSSEGSGEHSGEGRGEHSSREGSGEHR